MIESPIDKLSSNEKKILLETMEKHFLVTKKSGIIIEDYKTKWWNLYLSLIKWIQALPIETRTKLSCGKTYHGILIHLLNN